MGLSAIASWPRGTTALLDRVALDEWQADVQWFFARNSRTMPVSPSDN